MAMYVENFSAWAEEWYERYRKDKEKNRNLFCSITGIDPDNKRSRYTVVGNAKTGKIATAKRRTNEKHDKKIGVGVAYARYCGVEIPVERKPIPLQTLKNGDRFTTVYSKVDGIYIGKDSRANGHVWRNTNKGISMIRILDGNTLVYKN